MLLPEVKFESGQKVIECLSGENSVDSVGKKIKRVEVCVCEQNPVLYYFMQNRFCDVAKYFEKDTDPKLIAIAGCLGMCVVYDAVSMTCSDKKIPVPYVSNDTILSFCECIDHDFRNRKQDLSAASHFLKKLSVENLMIAKLLEYVANNSPNQLCGETTIISGGITYFLLGRQLESDLLEMMLE